MVKSDVSRRNCHTRREIINRQEAGINPLPKFHHDLQLLEILY